MTTEPNMPGYFYDPADEAGQDDSDRRKKWLQGDSKGSRSRRRSDTADQQGEDPGAVVVPTRFATEGDVPAVASDLPAENDSPEPPDSSGSGLDDPESAIIRSVVSNADAAREAAAARQEEPSDSSWFEPSDEPSETSRATSRETSPNGVRINRRRPTEAGRTFRTGRATRILGGPIARTTTAPKSRMSRNRRRMTPTAKIWRPTVAGRIRLRSTSRLRPSQILTPAPSQTRPATKHLLRPAQLTLLVHIRQRPTPCRLESPELTPRPRPRMPQKSARVQRSKAKARGSAASRSICKDWATKRRTRAAC